MKKILLSLVALFVVCAALSAETISQEEADGIVRERLCQEVQLYTVYAKEGVQKEMIITSSTGELLELNYWCWVYYIRYMTSQGRYLIVKESNGNLLEVDVKSGAEPTNLTEWREVNYSPSLTNTKWKLTGIVDVETGILKELEPKNCEKCYTLTFDTDSTFSAFSSTNELRGDYIVDYVTHSFHVTNFVGTKMGEIGDGDLYWDVWDVIQSFSLQTNELKLYYNSKNNYLLFK